MEGFDKLQEENFPEIEVQNVANISFDKNEDGTGNKLTEIKKDTDDRNMTDSDDDDEKFERVDNRESR